VPLSSLMPKPLLPQKAKGRALNQVPSKKPKLKRSQSSGHEAGQGHLQPLLWRLPVQKLKKQEQMNNLPAEARAGRVPLLLLYA